MHVNKLTHLRSWLRTLVHTSFGWLTMCAGGAAGSRRTPVRRASEERAGALAELSPNQKRHDQRDPGGSWHGGRGSVIGVGLVTVVPELHRMLQGVLRLTLELCAVDGCRKTWSRSQSSCASPAASHWGPLPRWGLLHRICSGSLHGSARKCCCSCCSRTAPARLT